jgi:phosphatidylserine decarboxylase
MKNQNTPIALEGFPFIAGFAALTLLVAFSAGKLGSAVLYGFSALFALLTLFAIYFFRNPRRMPPSDELAVLAPADGTVIVVDRVPVTPLGHEALKISIFMSVFNVHINRVPLSGRVVELTHTPGKFFDVRDSRSSCENERSTIVLEAASGVRLAFVQIAGLIARRIVCYAREGEMLERGRRYGLIRFGSRLDVYLPPDVQPLVKLGDRTVGGETVLGRLGGELIG